ncbi:MAG: lamin tail domain-containing protein, partial [Phycisphaerae bacterium]|nr:lamin tail domain-containing protein [Phycisphaerae bacterium]
MVCLSSRHVWGGFLVLCLFSCAALAEVVINEIHYNGEDNTAVNEFVELYNTASTSVDLSGWWFSDGIDFQFPQGSSIPA